MKFRKLDVSNSVTYSVGQKQIEFRKCVFYNGLCSGDLVFPKRYRQFLHIIFRITDDGHNHKPSDCECPFVAYDYRS
jgi:hypothetical protein